VWLPPSWSSALKSSQAVSGTSAVGSSKCPAVDCSPGLGAYEGDGLSAAEAWRLQTPSCQGWHVPDINGQVVILTVTDADRSAAWYCDLLGAEETGRYLQPDGLVAIVSITEPGSRIELCLACHGADAGSLSEYRAGLDHLEFLVPKRSALDAWVSRLDALGIGHSGVKQPSSTGNAMLTFRDPDNIQLEFFWRAPAR
jgi:glyoxylase I family protein